MLRLIGLQQPMALEAGAASPARHLRQQLESAFGRTRIAIGKAEIGIDRKILADMAVLDKPGFAAVVDKVKATLAA
mgnify:CR=1 FL=1